MIKRLLRTCDMMKNACWAAKASGCQHAGSRHATGKSASRNGHHVHTLMQKRLTSDVTRAACVRMHAQQRQNWNQSKRSGKKTKMHVGGKAGAGALETSPLVPAESLLPDSLGFSVVMRLASTSTGWDKRHAGLNVHVWPPNPTRRSPSPYIFNTFPTWPSTYTKHVAWLGWKTDKLGPIQALFKLFQTFELCLKMI